MEESWHHLMDDIYYYPDCETMTDVAYYYIDELQALGDIPPSLQNYIDYEAYGRKHQEPHSQDFRLRSSQQRTEHQLPEDETIEYK